MSIEPSDKVVFECAYCGYLYKEGKKYISRNTLPSFSSSCSGCGKKEARFIKKLADEKLDEGFVI